MAVKHHSGVSLERTHWAFVSALARRDQTSVASIIRRAVQFYMDTLIKEARNVPER